jgi:hypothetical protein
MIPKISKLCSGNRFQVPKFKVPKFKVPKFKVPK